MIFFRKNNIDGKGYDNGNCAEPVKFGTFAGVFTPSTLTILGVIMFLRFPMVVGSAGFWGALLVLLAAKFITLSTALSVSSIATNMRVAGGGAYYLISRSLGVEFGGMIALFFYAAQAVAVSIYVFGLTETLFSMFPDIGISFIMASTLVNVAVFVCVYIGAGWTIRLQYGVLAILILAVGSFFTGAILNFSPELLAANRAPLWTEKYSLFSVFALFFPAVTGIMAGVNMSGDLKEPERSIPRGTLAAIGFTFFVYLFMAVLLAGSNTRGILTGQSFVVKETAFWGVLIYAGVICATLSSALGSMMGAPRVLQAFARDNIFKHLEWLGKGSGPSNEPRRAIILTFIVAQAGIMTGGIDNIAPVITMFFLITYGTVNLACFYEMISNNPSFRPRFRLNHWIMALFGALACIIVMFAISFLWAVIAILLSAGTYFLIAREEIIVQWGDMKSGLAFQKVRNALFQLEQENFHPKNWRPSILALSGGAWNRLNLVKYACLLSANRGMVSLAQIITGDLEHCVQRQIEAEKIMRKFIREENLKAFPVVVVDENFAEALKSLLQCHGIGVFRSNTVLLGWSEDLSKKGAFITTINLAQKMGKNVLVLRCRRKEEHGYFPAGDINVWWNSPNSGPLMLIMAFLLRENMEWRGSSLRILRTAPPKADTDNIMSEMSEMLRGSRISAEIKILITDDPVDAVKREMKPSSVLFAGFDVADKNEGIVIPGGTERIMEIPGDMIIVHSAGEISLSA